MSRTHRPLGIGLESLEDRRMFAGIQFAALAEHDASGAGSLIVRGTAGNDHILVDYRPALDSYIVHHNGSLAGRFPAEAIERLVVDANAGDDRIYVNGRVRLAATLRGGEGNDVIRGGGAAAVIHGGAGNDLVVAAQSGSLLLGGDGNDRLRGRGGDDILHGGDGHDRIDGARGTDLLAGGQGHDQLKGSRQDRTADASRSAADDTPSWLENAVHQASARIAEELSPYWDDALELGQHLYEWYQTSETLHSLYQITQGVNPGPVFWAQTILTGIEIPFTDYHLPGLLTPTELADGSIEGNLPHDDASRARPTSIAPGGIVPSAGMAPASAGSIEHTPPGDAPGDYAHPSLVSETGRIEFLEDLSGAAGSWIVDLPLPSFPELNRQFPTTSPPGLGDDFGGVTFAGFDDALAGFDGAWFDETGYDAHEPVGSPFSSSYDPQVITVDPRWDIDPWQDWNRELADWTSAIDAVLGSNQVFSPDFWDSLGGDSPLAASGSYLGWVDDTRWYTDGYRIRVVTPDYLDSYGGYDSAIHGLSDAIDQVFGQFGSLGSSYHSALQQQLQDAWGAYNQRTATDATGTDGFGYWGTLGTGSTWSAQGTYLPNVVGN